MSQFDLLIKGGMVYTEAGFRKLDVAVNGEKIAALFDPDVVKEAKTILDVTGKYVLPGIIDTHTHLRDPGYTHKEDFETGTKAAAASGVTFVCPMPNLDPVINTPEAYAMEIAEGEKKSLIDFNPPPSPLMWRAGHVKPLSDMGCAYFKIFQKLAAYPYSTSASTIDTWELLNAFRAVAETGKFCTIHPFDHFFFDHAPEDVKKAGLDWNIWNYMPAIYTDEEMAGASFQLYYLARKAGMRWMCLHVWHPNYIDLIRWAKAHGEIEVVGTTQAMSGGILETMETREKGYKIYYKPTESWIESNIWYVGDIEYTWEAINDGTIDIVDSDHAPHRMEEFMHTDPTKAAMGFPILDWYGHLMLNEVNSGNLSLERMVEVTSVNQARVLGLYPRKGSILPGTDADFTIADLNKEWTINSDVMYTKTQLNPYHGRKIKGQVTHTIVRGTSVMANGKVIGKPGFGQFVKADPSIALPPINCNKSKKWLAKPKPYNGRGK